MRIRNQFPFIREHSHKIFEILLKVLNAINHWLLFQTKLIPWSGKFIATSSFGLAWVKMYRWKIIFHYIAVVQQFNMYIDCEVNNGMAWWLYFQFSLLFDQQLYEVLQLKYIFVRSILQYPIIKVIYFITFSQMFI